MTEPTQAQITEAVKLKFKFAKGPVIYGGELAELIAHIRRTPRPQGSTMKPDWHDRPTEPVLWCAKHGAAAEKPCDSFVREPGTEGDE